jgi:RNA polymerase sigma factor (sigma-70 family)
MFGPDDPDPHGRRAQLFEEWYRRDMANLILFAIRLGAGQDTAWDLAHQACVNAYPRWFDINDPSAYLRTSVRNAYIKSAQSHEKIDMELCDIPALEDPSIGKIEFEDQEHEIFAAIRQLPVHQREAIAWAIDGYQPAEIARLVGSTAGAIRGNLFKARKALRQLVLQPRGDDHGRP